MNPWRDKFAVASRSLDDAGVLMTILIFGAGPIPTSAEIRAKGLIPFLDERGNVIGECWPTSAADSAEEPLIVNARAGSAQ